MRVDFLEFKNKVGGKVFSINDIYKLFQDKKDYFIRQKLHRYQKKGLIHRLKKGLYCFDINDFHPFEMANFLYQPSYISCQSALFYYGIIIDVPQKITSITTVTTKRLVNEFGSFIYYKINKILYYGFETKEINHSKAKIATPEKALLDFFYINKIKNIVDLRLNLKNLDKNKYFKLMENYPSWIKKIKLNF
ncbi:MAG: type IV toxin-antitoxin system AbiEi family antitoxin domain-containing protein [Microgenomates group bacterium]